MTVRRLSWEMMRFTGIDDGPVYIDLTDVSAITDAKGYTGELIPGARVVLYGGFTLFVKESADAVFTEVHRARTEQEPTRPSSKYSDSAPALLDGK